MKLRCLGSGSAGNCYILENDTEALVIEAGVRFKDVKIALNFNISKVVGVIVSHIHKDHSASAGDFEKIGIPVFKPYESEMERQVRTYGNFVVKSFPLVHDTPCFGFLVEHPEMGGLLYASDTEYIKYRFSKLDHILVEANYSMEYLLKTEAKRDHVLAGHMSIDTTEKFVKVNMNPDLRNVVLLHLSKGSANPLVFRKRIEGVVGTNVNVEIAIKELEIDLNTVPL